MEEFSGRGKAFQVEGTEMERIAAWQYSMFRDLLVWFVQ